LEPALAVFWNSNRGNIKSGLSLSRAINCRSRVER
jgi:hypothetical protein